MPVQLPLNSLPFPTNPSQWGAGPRLPQCTSTHRRVRKALFCWQARLHLALLEPRSYNFLFLSPGPLPRAHNHIHRGSLVRRETRENYEVVFSKWCAAANGVCAASNRPLKIAFTWSSLKEMRSLLESSASFPPLFALLPIPMALSFTSPPLPHPPPLLVLIIACRQRALDVCFHFNRHR